MLDKQPAACCMAQATAAHIAVVRGPGHSRTVRSAPRTRGTRYLILLCMSIRFEPYVNQNVRCAGPECLVPDLDEASGGSIDGSKLYKVDW
jgi:hypothetical protein